MGRDLCIIVLEEPKRVEIYGKTAEMRKDLLTNRFQNGILLKHSERYRSGHNEAVLKTVCPKGTRVRIPSSPPSSAALHKIRSHITGAYFLCLKDKTS